MTRYILDESNIHPNIREDVSNNHRTFVEEVMSVIDREQVVVIGMAMNPVCKTACKLLRKQKISFEYLEYGSYLNDWRKRNALKMWTGWKTFPMIFVDGVLIGGATELNYLIKSDELLSASH